MTVEKDSTFSDSEASQEELCFLPAIPSPDVPEQQDKYPASLSKLEESTHSGSPFSVEAGQNGQAHPASSPLEGNFLEINRNISTVSCLNLIK